jgi:DNA-binding transcriptional LysR family regulator
LEVTIGVSKQHGFGTSEYFYTIIRFCHIVLGVIDLHRLRMFHAVVTEGSIHAAADLLGFTPSTVSQHVAILQRETGLSLLERRGRGLAPTAAGLRFAEAAGELLGRAENLQVLASDLREGRRGSCRISYIASAGAAFLPPVVSRLNTEFPDVRLDLRLRELSPGPGWIPDIEIAAVQSAQAADLDGYRTRALFRDPFRVVVPADHPLANRTELPASEIVGQPLIDNDLGRGPCRDALHGTLRGAGIQATYTIEAHDYAAALEFVAAGAGLSIIPSLGVRHPPDCVRVLDLVDPTPERIVVLRTRLSVHDHPVVQRADELLLEQVTAH